MDCYDINRISVLSSFDSTPLFSVCLFLVYVRSDTAGCFGAHLSAGEIQGDQAVRDVSPRFQSGRGPYRELRGPVPGGCLSGVQEGKREDVEASCQLSSFSVGVGKGGGSPGVIGLSSFQSSIARALAASISLRSFWCSSSRR